MVCEVRKDNYFLSDVKEKDRTNQELSGQLGKGKKKKKKSAEVTFLGIYRV